MIVWINGAFGSGKSTVAQVLTKRVKGSFVYDPEQAGYFLRKNQPSSMRLDNFQDDPLWREINYLHLRSLNTRFNGVVFAPQTIFIPLYYSEIIGRLRLDGIDVRHVLLRASKKTILKRLGWRLDGSGSWPAIQIDKCLEGFTDPIFENQLDTDGLTAAETAGLIMELTGL